MNGKILSVSDVTDIEKSLYFFREQIKLFYENVNDAINVFNSNPIAQSFYESGPFGMEKEEKLKQLKSAIEQYYSIIDSGSDSLIPQTQRFIEEQLALLNNGGGSAGTRMGFDKPNIGPGKGISNI